MRERRSALESACPPRACGRREGLLLCLLAGFVLSGCGPLGPLPGGALRGESTPLSAVQAAFGEGIDRAQLETRPTRPHSVNTWFLIRAGTIYFPTSMILGPTDPSKRSWVQHVADDPRIRLRIGRRLFEGRAEKMPPGAEQSAVRAALEARYGIEPQDRDPERAVWIYRLVPR